MTETTICLKSAWDILMSTSYPWWLIVYVMLYDVTSLYTFLFPNSFYHTNKLIMIHWWWWTGTKGNFQETHWKRERLWPQVRRLSNALWHSDNKDGAYQCTVKKRRVPCFKGCHNHGQPEWPCSSLSLVYSEQERLQGFPERSSKVPQKCPLLEGPTQRCWNWCHA